MLDEIIDGRSDLVFEYLTESHAANSADKDGTSLVQWCAYGDAGTINAGAVIDAKDMYGHSPLLWASWYSRPIPIPRKLCYGDFRIHPKLYGRGSSPTGEPHS
jgi:uncharacterized protein